MDEQTEILTADGWKTLDTLKAGDATLTLDHQTGQTVWQPVSEVCIFPAQPREMILMEGREHSSLTTPNHRWPVERKNSRAGRYERRWATTETLSAGDRIPLAGAPYPADIPTEPKLANALVELVAWFYTEGCMAKRDGRVRRSLSLSQSCVKNPENVDRIRAALGALFGPPVADRTLSHSVPRWNENTEPRGMVIFKLNNAAGDVLTEYAPGKVPSTTFLRSLTVAQLELFIAVSMLADNGGVRRFAQKDRARAEQFALACILAGYPVSIRPRPVPKYGYDMWVVQMLRKKHVYPQESKRETNRFQVRRVGYNGRVWCPRTPNQTWLARRNGAVYFTGNTTMPDPNFQFLGMSWLTPLLREVQADALMTEHKYRYFSNASTPNLAVKFDPQVPIEMVKAFKGLMENEHRGAFNAWKTLYLGGGADVTVVGANLKDLDYAVVQGHGEARLSASAGVPASWVGFSEGLQGSSLNAGNFHAQRRQLFDGTLHGISGPAQRRPWRRWCRRRIRTPTCGSTRGCLPPGRTRRHCGDPAAAVADDFGAGDAGVRPGFGGQGGRE